MPKRTICLYNFSLLASPSQLLSKDFWKLDENALPYFIHLGCPSTCGGSHDDWACCKGECPCLEAEGDCDSDAECEDGLFCHQSLDNCGAGFPAGFDCCARPPESAGYIPGFLRMLENNRGDRNEIRPAFLRGGNIWEGTYLYRRPGRIRTRPTRPRASRYQNFWTISP